MGLGGLLLIVGTVGSVGSALTSNGEPINSEEAYTGVDLKVSADVINAETGEEFHKCFNVQARNTADAKEHFESEAVRHGYIVDGEVSVDLPATNNSGQNVSSEQRQSSIKAFQFESTRVFAALDSLPQNYWRNGIIIGTSLWGALLVGPVFSLIGGTLGAVLAYVYAVFYIGIPASVYMDSYHVQQDTEWNPSKHIYAGLAVIPWLNVVVGMFYLFRRRYAIQNREFSIPTIREDISTVSQRFKSKLQD